jgi:hypothetical protein
MSVSNTVDIDGSHPFSDLADASSPLNSTNSTLPRFRPVTSLEFSHAILHEAYQLSQPPLSDALILLAARLFNTKSPAEEIKKRVGRQAKNNFVDVRASSSVFFVVTISLICALHQAYFFHGV